MTGGGYRVLKSTISGKPASLADILQLGTINGCSLPTASFVILTNQSETYFDRQCVEVVEHDMVRLRKNSRFTLHREKHRNQQQEVMTHSKIVTATLRVMKIKQTKTVIR